MQKLKVAKEQVQGRVFEAYTTIQCLKRCSLCSTNTRDKVLFSGSPKGLIYWDSIVLPFMTGIFMLFIFAYKCYIRMPELCSFDNT